MHWETGYLVWRVMIIGVKWRTVLGALQSESSAASSPEHFAIFYAQGSRGENESSFGLEMSEIGFSTHRLQVGQTLTLCNTPEPLISS